MKFTPFIYNKMMPVINLRVSTSINANLLVPRQLGKKILKEESEGTLRLLLESFVYSFCLVEVAGTAPREQMVPKSSQCLMNERL